MRSSTDIPTWIRSGLPSLAVLIDPDKSSGRAWQERLAVLRDCAPHVILLGGSTMMKTDLKRVIADLRAVYEGEIWLFPGSGYQLCSEADGILLLSMISGRNPDLLIGRQVDAAPLIRDMDLCTLSTGYMLIDGGRPTSVSYMSQTLPIPADKPTIAVATGMAGEMLGMQCLYLEAGSGAHDPVPIDMLERCRAHVSIPIITGGGLRTVEQVIARFSAGADICVIGSMIEDNPRALIDLVIHTQELALS